MATKNELSQDQAFRIHKEKDLRIVKGIFKNYEAPGQTLKFWYKKYKDVPERQYVLEHNKTYEIPYMVQDHINNNCVYVMSQWLQDETGRPHQGAGKEIVKRFGFHSLEF